MKKLIESILEKALSKVTLVVALALLALPLQAQRFQSQRVINSSIRALASGTNNYGITNLLAITTNLVSGSATNYIRGAHGTNAAWTNFAGALILNTNYTGVSATNSVANFGGLFDDIRFWADREGRWYLPASYTSSGNSGTNYITSPLTLFIRTSTVTNTIANYGIVFAPIWDGTNTPTSTADDWVVTNVTSVAQYSTYATNIPLYKWPGAYGLRVRYITNDLGGATNNIHGLWFQDISVNGYVP